MPIRDLDCDQKRAATSGGPEVVVSAGAGSGKTRLLVGRYLYEVMNNAVPMHKIAAITFTNKAAGQMKARISQRIPELAERYPEHENLWTELGESIHAAPISTIHSFCNSILRTFPLEAGIDPLFQVLDETTLAGLKDEAWRQFLQKRLDEEPERYGMLLRSLGMRGLRRIMNDLLNRRAHLVIWLDRRGIPDPDALEEEYRRFIIERLAKHRSMLRYFHVSRPGEDGFSDCLNALLYEFDEVRRAFENDDEDAAAAARLRDAARNGMRKGSRKAWKEAGFDLDGVKNGVKECLAFLDMVESWRSHERGTAARTASCLLDEFARFERYFLDIKKSRSSLDHDDSLIETWRLLRAHPAVCRKVSGSYQHILVDEFQDTDELQLDILHMITGNSAARLFTVGDPKQSIYRFRGADLTVFNRFAARSEVDFLSLKINYRSSPSIIQFVNDAFGRILGMDDPEFLFEARYAEMKSFRKTDDVSSNVEIAVFDSNNADACRSREGEYIAKRVLEFHREGYNFAEMALLLRKGTQSRRYEEALLRAGIPFVNLAGGNTFDSPEASDIANLLGWLCEPDDQTVFSALLISPFFGADADLLYTVRTIAGKQGSLPEAFMRSDFSGTNWSVAVEEIRRTLRHLLAARDRRTIREILELAFQETGYTISILADPIRGEGALAALDLLMHAADSFESNGGGIRDFARLLHNGEFAVDRIPTVETSEDALSVITIHKAKGMEYKAVFLADAAGRPRNESHSWLMHDSLGPGFTLRSSSGKTMKTLALNLASEEEKRKALAESKRLFYVACTRAENRLIITGGRPSKNADPKFEKDNWMGWLFDAFEISRESDEPLVINGNVCSWRFYKDTECGSRVDLTENWKHVLANEPGDAIPGRIDLSPVEIRPLFFSGKPDTLSPTQAEDYLACPALYARQRAGNFETAMAGGHSSGFGALYGDLAHHALELWDYRSPDRLIASVDMLAGRNIPDRDRQSLRDCFRSFAASGLCRMLAEADVLRREERFAFILEGTLVRGKMDLLALIGDRWVIVDYKTHDISPEAAPEQAERHRFQTGIYALALHRAEHVIPDRLIIHFLTPGISCETPCDLNFVNDVQKKLIRMIERMEQGDFSPRPSERCGGCPHVNFCVAAGFPKEVIHA